mmetsp:Transcript_16301/g.37380  ORF Transcript_16301/g.37380 Transcript_16301/m.37380 type:complete len:154 (+) Transcript_16301:1-462(+)
MKLRNYKIRESDWNKTNEQGECGTRDTSNLYSNTSITYQETVKAKVRDRESSTPFRASRWMRYQSKLPGQGIKIVIGIDKHQCTFIVFQTRYYTYTFIHTVLPKCPEIHTETQTYRVRVAFYLSYNPIPSREPIVSHLECVLAVLPARFRDKH